MLPIKVFVSSLLLLLVFKKAGAKNILAHLGSMDLRYFALSSLLHVIIIFVAAVRWRLLLEEKYPVKKLFSLYFIGSFFNNILPGSVGGDSVKIYYLYKDSGKGGESFGSVFLDRYIGLLGLLAIGLAAGFAAFENLKTVRMQWFIPLLVAAYLGGSFLVFSARIGKRFAIINTFYEYLHRYLQRKQVLFYAFLLSVVIQALSIGMVWLIALGIGQTLSFTALFVFVPIVVTVMTLPVSISGFGVRESAFVVLFGLTGVPAQESVAISVLWFLSIAAASLIGLIEYLRYRRRPEKSWR